MAFDIAAINAELGAYARENSQRIFLDAIYSPDETGETTPWDIMEKQVILDELAAATADFDLEVMEASDTFTSQGNVVDIDGVIYKLRDMDSSFELPVYSLHKSWMQHIFKEGYKNNLNEGDVKAGKLSFSAWLIENLQKKFMEKFRLLTSFQGVYAAGYGYGTGSFGAALDGLNTQVRAHRTSGKIPAGQVVATGAITSANAYQAFEDMGKALPTKLLYKDHFLLHSVDNGDNYNIDYRANHYNNNPKIYDKYKRPRLDDRMKVSLMSVPEFGSDGLVWSTPLNNIFWFSDFKERPPQILTAVADPKVIKVTMMYSAAFGFKRPDHLVCNDVV